MSSNFSINDGRKIVPVKVVKSDNANEAGFLARTGQAGDEAIGFLVESVQTLVVNTCLGVVKTVTLTVDGVHCVIDITLQSGRNYRSITKKMNTVESYSKAIAVAQNSDYDPVLKEILMQELINECSSILQKNLRES